MKKLLLVLLMCLSISTNVFSEDKMVTINVRINKLSQEQADQIPAKVNEIFKGSCKVDVVSKPVPPKGKSWKYNEMTNLFPEPETIIVPYHHGDHGDRRVSHQSHKSSPPSLSPSPKPSPDKDGKCHHHHKGDKDGHHGKDNHHDGDKDGHHGKSDHNCSNGDKSGHDGKGKCGHGDKNGHNGKGNPGHGDKSGHGHGDHGKGGGHCGGGHGRGR